MTQAEEQLTVVAFLRAKEGKSEELGRRLSAVVEPTRREPGNLNYDLHRSCDDPNLWVLYENWASAAALDAHFETPYLKDLFGRLSEVTDGPPDIRRLSMTTTAEPARRR